MTLRQVIGAATAAAGAGLGYAYLETKRFVVREVTVPVLPAGATDVRVLHVSDLHVLPSGRRKLAWVRSLADLAPDLVVNTGDNLAHPDAVAPLVAALAPLLRRPGVFVNGSNDYWAPIPKNPARYLLRDARLEPNEPRPLPWGQLVNAFTEAGWADLNNHRAVVTLADGRRLSFVGTDDAHLDLDEFPAPMIESPDSAAPLLHIGVTHAPYQRVLSG
ncbi:MAG: metallophosphoesterase family protein, partial [Promicromonosporaceae bacterium]|nr:metallophosphoesterase family protein [Promicromonosporaceae bacterium]